MAIALSSYSQQHAQCVHIVHDTDSEFLHDSCGVVQLEYAHVSLTNYSLSARHEV